MTFDILKEPLIKSLLDGSIYFHEVMNTYNISVTIANMTTEVLGFVYVSSRGRYHLILNGNIDFKTQCEVFLHEVCHITEDVPKKGYLISLDMQRTELELNADILRYLVS